MTKAQPEITLAPLLTEHWEQAARKITDLAEAFPANQFESRPCDHVRSFAEVLRHVAFWNNYLADSLRGKDPDGSANELPQQTYPDKASVLKVLARSSQDVVATIRDRESSLDSKAAALVMSFIEHTAEHYGQLAVYARLKGVTPPASRS